MMDKLSQIDFSQATKVESFPIGVLANCSNLTKIVFPPNLKQIDSVAIGYCPNLQLREFGTESSLPNLTHIVAGAFSGSGTAGVIGGTV
jgi:hypothetical protein